MVTQPDISVVIPTYNRADILPRAIKSVLNQTKSDFELIVVDDGSTDDTGAVVESFDDERVRYIRQENSGANAARNNGISHARGNIISFLDSDDEFAKHHLETVKEVFDSDRTDFAGVLTSYRSDYGDRVNRKIISSDKIPLEDIINKNVVIGFSCLTITTSVFNDVGYLDEQLESSQDYDFLIRLYQLGYTIRGCDRPLVIKYKDELDRISDNTERRLAGTQKILQKHDGILTDNAKARLYYLMALAHSKNGDFENARADYKNTVRHDPQKWLAYLHYAATVHPAVYSIAMMVKRKTKQII